MIVDRYRVKEELELRPFGQKGWLKNRLRCPFCGESDKWGVLFVDEGGIFNCFKGSCGTKTSVFNYLKQIDREDLIEFEKTVSKKISIASINDIIDSDNEKESEKEKQFVCEKILNLPFKSKQIISDTYLNSRGFQPFHYDKYKPVETNSYLEKRLNGYIIFQIFQFGRLASWMARSRESKSFHKENFEKYKRGEAELRLRYINSEGTDFGTILGGIDNITDNTEMVILVEGLFDSVGVDNKLNLLLNDKARSCFTFGNKISDTQISLLRSKKNIKTVVLFYDIGATQQMKQYSMKLNRYFETFLAVCKTENDPGDMCVQDMNDIFSNLQTPQEYYLNNI